MKNLFLDDFRQPRDAYYIGSYVIQLMNGQGSVIKIEKQIYQTLK